MSKKSSKRMFLVLRLNTVRLVIGNLKPFHATFYVALSFTARNVGDALDGRAVNPGCELVGERDSAASARF